jgi:hypothetical protein
LAWKRVISTSISNALLIFKAETQVFVSIVFALFPPMFFEAVKLCSLRDGFYVISS